MTDVDPANIPPPTAPIPNSLRLLMMLSENLRLSTGWMADYCQNDQNAMDQLALNHQLLEMAEPAIQNALLKIENAADEERKKNA